MMGSYGYEIPSWFLTQNVKTAGELLQSETKISLTTGVSHKSELFKGEDESCGIEENDRKYELQNHIYQELLDITKGALLSCNISEQYHSQQPTILLQVPLSTEIDFIDSVLEQLARDVGANLISVDLEDLADVAIEFSRQDFESEFKYSRQDFETENLSSYGSAESYLSVAYESDTDVSDSDWDDWERNREAVEAILDAPKLKTENHQSASKSGRNSSKNCPPAFVHIRDAMRIMTLGKGKNILKTFRTTIQDRRGLGESMILFVTVFLEQQDEKKNKMILYLRHKLQKGFLSREKPPQEEEMEQMNQQMAQLEKYESLESGIIRTTKISKVLKAIIKLESIPHESEYKFKERSQSLLNKWAPSLELEGKKFRRKILVDSAAIVDIAQPNHEGHSRKDELHRTQEINVRRLKRALRGKVCVGFCSDLLDPHASWDGSMLKLISEALEKSQWPEIIVERMARRIIGRIWDKSTLELDDICEVIRQMDQTIEDKPSNSAEKLKKIERSCGEGIKRMDQTFEDKTSKLEEKLKKIEKNCSKYEKDLFTCVVDPEKLQVAFDDVIVEQEVKDTVEQLISMSNFRPNGIQHRLLSQIRITGLLLYGPPGTGKTHLTRAIAKKSGASMITLTAADIQSKWVGETEKYIKAVFSLSEKLAPSVVFIDEVDSLFRGRSSGDRSHTRSATNQFLQEMDGFCTGKDSPFVVVATNRPMDLDEAFLRRLPQKIFLPLPSEKNRCRILKTFLKEEDLSPPLSIEGLAKLTEGYSGSDLRYLCGQAGLIFATEQMRAQQTGGTAASFAHLLLDKGHFGKALERTKPSVSKQILKEIEEFTRRFNPQSIRHLRSGENAKGPQEICHRTEHEGDFKMSETKNGYRVDAEDTGHTSPLRFNVVPTQAAYRRPIIFGGPSQWNLDPVKWHKDLELLPNRMIEPFPADKPLCTTCKDLNFDELARKYVEIPHHKSFTALENSAEACPFCALIFNSIQSRGAFTANADSPIRLIRTESSKPGAPANMTGIKALYYCDDPEREMRAKGNGNDVPIIFRSYMRDVPDREGILEVVGNLLTVFADPDSLASISGDILGRPIYGAQDMSLSRAWLSTCMKKHPECNRYSWEQVTMAPSADPPLPLRVIDVGPPDGSRAPFLSIGTARKGRYLTLSYRWGSSAQTKTTTATLEKYQSCIPIESLSKCIQDAIHITRQLGFCYLWVDSLCIIQDLHNDWSTQASLMADIYRNSTLTLSASIAKSADDGLILPTRSVRCAKLPYQSIHGTVAGVYYICDRKWYGKEAHEDIPSTFHDDVMNGSLSTRAWCLQERALSRRVLHFGRDQLHWECLRGRRSEEVEGIQAGANFVDPVGRLRNKLLSFKTFSEIPPELRDPNCDHEFLSLLGNTPEISIFRQFAGIDQPWGREPYSYWYQLVEQYMNRQLTIQADRLPAIGGIAKAFAQFIDPGAYIAGIWVQDLLSGLLWRVVRENKVEKLPEDPTEPTLKTCPPSWSWGSVDCPIIYPRHILGDFDITDRGVIGHLSWHRVFETPEPAILKITGRLRPMQGMRGYTMEFAHWLDRNYENLDFDCIPEFWFDKYGYPIKLVECLLIAQQKCHLNCRHAAGCDVDKMAFVLMLCYIKRSDAYLRVGMAKVYMSSYDRIKPKEIFIM